MRLKKPAARKEIKRILIIDGDVKFRKMLGRMLTAEGFIITEASNGEMGIQCQMEQPADLVIADINMPIKNGIETIQSLQEMDSDTRFITVSGGRWYGADVEFDIVQKLGAVTLEKPFKKQKILETIGQFRS